MNDPGFWQNQEQAQALLQKRKKSEKLVAADEKLARSLSDLDTYFDLAHAETNAEQRDSLLTELNGEFNAAEAYVAELETDTLLAGENDRLNAIVTVKPGAGGTESQDWAEMLAHV